MGKYKPDTPRNLDEAIMEIKAASREHAEAGAADICLGLNFALGVLDDLKRNSKGAHNVNYCA